MKRNIFIHFITKYKYLALCWIFAGAFGVQSYANNTIIGYRTADHEDYSRVVVEFNAKPDYHVFTLSDPTRIVVDVNHTTYQNQSTPPIAAKRIKAIRYAKRDNGQFRMVVDVPQPMRINKHYILPPSKGKRYRLVVDLSPENPILDAFIVPAPITKAGIDLSVPMPKIKRSRKPLIIIDAGHGGHDPGSLGRKGTKEKIITLSYAKALKDSLMATGRYRVYMTRSTDVYVPLRERVKRAESTKGDLFISLHADSHKNRKVKGLSVYTLSEKASDKEAAALARHANTAGEIGHMKVDYTEEEEIASLLVDMVQRDTKNTSSRFAEGLVDSLKERVTLLRNTHRFAGFRVLTSASIPSVLIELGYLSNRKEEVLLRSKKYKKKLVSSIVQAIDIHFGASEKRYAQH